MVINRFVILEKFFDFQLENHKLQTERSKDLSLEKCDVLKSYINAFTKEITKHQNQLIRIQRTNI